MTKLLGSLLAAAGLVGCGVESPDLGSNAGDSYEEFKSKLGREPGTGAYILDWDIVIHDEAKLYEYWSSLQQGALTIHTAGGMDVKWSDAQKRNLTYCIGASFGGNKQLVVSAMAAAAEQGWEKFGDVNFIYLPEQDANCNAQNPNVVFDVNQVNSGGQYLARAFFPNSPRVERSVMIDPASFSPQQTGGISLTNIVIHELGHALGFRHEHIRAPGAQCLEDNNYKGITNYDQVSTMHYPQCGSPNNTLALSQLDQQGVALVYGAPLVAQAPMTGFAFPAEGATVPPTFTVKASVVDADNNLTRVELHIDGAIYGAPKTTAPFEFEVTNLVAGGHTLEIKATDGGGLTSTTEVNITVSANGGGGSGTGGGTGSGTGGGTGGGDGASADVVGGCSTTGGSTAGLLFGLALVGLVRRRRS